MTYLVFDVAHPNNQSSTVKNALQDVVLYLQMHGLPVYRFHADKGEFYNHKSVRGYETKASWERGQNQVCHRAMDMPNPPLDG